MVRTTHATTRMSAVEACAPLSISSSFVFRFLKKTKSSSDADFLRCGQSVVEGPKGAGASATAAWHGCTFQEVWCVGLMAYHAAGQKRTRKQWNLCCP
jgi:hypothetical protein